MSTHNIRFHWEIRKILCGYHLLLVAMRAYTFMGSNSFRQFCLPSEKGSTLKGKNFVPHWRKFFPFRVELFQKRLGGGWVRGRCLVAFVTRASIRYWLTVGQGLLSLEQVRVEGKCYFFYSFIFFHFPLSSLFLSFICTISSPFLWETTQNDPQGLTCPGLPLSGRTT